jgi:hypothetical protein
MHVRAHAISADFLSKLIRNQQVLGSSPSAGSSLQLSDHALSILNALAADPSAALRAE